jgi:hypothetical protein
MPHGKPMMISHGMQQKKPKTNKLHIVIVLSGKRKNETIMLE